jgi:diguanylate cyclase (GGDEF)-like protein
VADKLGPWLRLDIHRMVFLTRVLMWIVAGIFAIGSPYDIWVWIGAGLVTIGGGLAVRRFGYMGVNLAAVAVDLAAITWAVGLSGGSAGDTWVLYGGEALSLTAYGSLRWTVLGAAVIVAAYAWRLGPAALAPRFAFQVVVLMVFVAAAGAMGRGFVVQKINISDGRRRLAQFDNLRAMQDNLLRDAPLEVLLDTLLRQGLQLVDLELGYIGIPDTQNLMHMKTQVGLTDRSNSQVWDTTTSEPTATAVRLGQMVVYNQVSADKLADVAREGFGSIAMTPLYDGRTLLGVLAVGSPKPDRVTAELKPLIQALATIAVGQIRYDRERAASRKRGRLLTTLERVGRLMNSNLHMKSLLPTLHQTVAEELQTDTFFVMLTIAHDANQVYMAYLYDDGREYSPEVLPLPTSGPTAEVIRTGEARLYEGVPPGAGIIGSPRDVVGMVVAPLRHESRVIGAISAQSYRSAYDQDHLEFLSAVASQAAIAIENAQLYQRTEEIALTDHMTGLGNSRRFEATLAQMVERADPDSHPLALLMIDSDSLKRINDQYGHRAGDAHILQLARAISGNVRAGDVACRYAGDEFVVLLPDTPLTAAERVGERIRMAVAEGFTWEDGTMIPTSVSVGVASFMHGMSMDDLFSRADQAMYGAKQDGRNRVTVMP